MADSLFDNRYRYDYIYPRGRSGETLRAVDTQEGERPVVIKRPAPQDAPPIRAGQEVSILNERKALTRLAGHPVLTALLNSGQFSVGGVIHQYIVMERADGALVADIVHDLAARGERMPELEMLVITDLLVDLLGAAHTADIVYNDVDAKHLFWNRDTYHLKVIDWGNAVFLEGDEITPQGVSKQSDIYQLGELLFFITTGGGRIEFSREAARSAGDDFRLDFTDDAERVSPKLQAIISRAAHPNPRHRYRTLAEFRKELGDYRSPLERERNTTLGRVNDRLRRDLSKDELTGLLRTLEGALALDPGFPAARQAQTELYARTNDLEVGADLDAARIYLESGNWTRAVPVLEELRPRARGDMAILIALLLDWAKILQDNNLAPASTTVLEAIALLFENDANDAARVLLTQGLNDDRSRALQWLLAERISAHVNEILLLRPNLYRLEVALASLAGEGVPVSEPRTLLGEVNRALNELAELRQISLIALRDGYRGVVDQLSALNSLLEVTQIQQGASNRKLPLSSMTRAMNAAMALADNMHVIGKQATSSPRETLAALDSARQIAPATPAWEGVARLLDSLYELLGAYQTYIPAADGSDLANWLALAQKDLQPFSDRLFDEMLVGMINGLNMAERAWQGYGDSVVQGSRAPAVNAIAQATEAVGTVSPSLAGWLNQLRNVVNGAVYIERHALYGALGRALADGWEQFDRGRLPESERLGIQAMQAARSDAERFAARRLRELAQHSREWLERGGVNDLKRSQATLTAVEFLFTPDEIGARDAFQAQMPTKETYLKAMSRGLIEVYTRASTAATRILFVNDILLGTLDAHEDSPTSAEDALFWRDAAAKALGDNGPRHPLTRALEEFVERRRDLVAASLLLNEVNSARALKELDATRRALEENPQVKLLQPAILSLREVEGAVRDWADGDFRTAGGKLENAVKAVDELEANTQITLTGYRAWLMSLLQQSADLYAQLRKLGSMVEAKPDNPVEFVRTAHTHMVDTTAQLLGEANAVTLRGWRDMYDSFLHVYTDRTLRRSPKLARFNDLFSALFIDRHPAYPLYRHWYEIVEQSPEPQLATGAAVSSASNGEPAAENVEAPAFEGAERYAPQAEYIPVYNREPAPRTRRRLLPFVIVGALLVLLLGAYYVFAVLPAADPVAATRTQLAALQAVGVTISPTPSEVAPLIEMTAEAAGDSTQSSTSAANTAPTALPGITSSSIAASLADTTDEIAAPTVAATIPARVSPSSTPTTSQPPTETHPPSATPTPSLTFTPSNTPTRTFTPVPTLPPNGLQGRQDLLALAALQPTPLWDEQAFYPQEGGYWRLGTEAVYAAQSETDTLVISPPAALLNTAYGNTASDRIVRVEAQLLLITYNPPLLVNQDVYFGVLLQDAADPTNNVGIEIMETERGVTRLSRIEDDAPTVVSQRAESATNLRVRIDRDLTAGTAIIYVNDAPLGAPIPFVNADTPILPALFIHDGDVVVHVTSWTVTLR